MTGKPPFESVVSAHGSTVLRVCRAILGPADADDAWSETFLSALNAYPGLPADANVEAWLVTIAHRKAIDVTRAAARRAIPVAETPDRPAGPDDRLGPPSSVPPSGGGGLVADDDLADAITRLPAKQKRAVAYHYLAGLPYADVAVILGGTAEAARRAAADGIARLRRSYPAPRPDRRPARPRTDQPRPVNRPGCRGSYLIERNVPMITDDTPRVLAQAFPDDQARLSRLHTRLAAAAQQDGVLDVAYRTMDSPVGPLLLAATEQGLIRVAFAREGHDAVLQTLADKVSPRILSAPVRLDAAARELDEYFAGRRHAFDLPLDWRLSAGFRRTVLSHLPEIGYGHTASYSAVAQLAGSPKAVRAVGTACATNPLPLVVPCHRVVRSDGSMGGYRGGPDAKRTLLTLEEAAA